MLFFCINIKLINIGNSIIIGKQYLNNATGDRNKVAYNVKINPNGNMYLKFFRKIVIPIKKINITK